MASSRPSSSRRAKSTSACFILELLCFSFLCGRSASEIKSVIAELSALFDVTNEGEIDAYFEVKIVRSSSGDSIELTQPYLIQHILDDVGMKPNSKTKDKAAPSSTILRRDLDGKPFAEKWDYRSIVGKLNFSEKSTRPEITCAVHQCARFVGNPRQSHANAVKHLHRYLLATKDKGLILRPDVSKSFEVHVDCDFAGNWVKLQSTIQNQRSHKSSPGSLAVRGPVGFVYVLYLLH
jgi:hypothetical protein